MPTNPANARILLKSGRAKVVSKEPFTIQLLYDSTENIQDLTVGVDPGSGTAGFAVVDQAKGEIVYRSEVQLRQDISRNMNQRSNYRRTRRNRKTRYRKARFLNRRNSIRKNRLSPTVVSKIQAHEREIKLIGSILPIKTVVYENAQFDIHAITNPEVLKDKSLYQKGQKYGFENTKAYVLYRDGHTCQYCKGKSKDKRLQVHHKIFKSENGTDAPDNLVTVCATCHARIHDEAISPKWKGKIGALSSPATQLNIIVKRLGELLIKLGLTVKTTFGFITKVDRTTINLEKTHSNDAIAVASGAIQINDLSQLYIKKCVAKGDYQLTKGKRSEKRLNVGKINGFKKYDKVYHDGQYCFVKGRISTGYMILMDIYGKTINFSPLPKPETTKRISARKSVISVRVNLP